MSKRAILLTSVAALTLSTFAQAAPNGGKGLLLIPDQTTSTGRKVWAFDPFDGSLINSSYIPQNTTLFGTPREAIQSGVGTILVSDQVTDAVHEFNESGAFLRTVVSASQVDNVRGIAVRNGQLFVTVGSGAGADTIQRFDQTPAGLYINQTTFTTFVDSPFDVAFRQNDLLITSFFNTNTKNPLQFDVLSVPFPPGGAAPYTPINLVQSMGLSSTSQVTPLADGSFYVAGFNNTSNTAPTATAGIYHFAANGVLIQRWLTPTGPRGVFPLGNGNIIYSDATGVRSLNPGTGVSTTITTGGNFHYVGFVPEPTALAALAPLGTLLIRRRR
jgi:hypothetical protein